MIKNFQSISKFKFQILNYWRSQVGFTLVELLVVIGIIALVMVAVFPNFTGARERARDNQRKSDLKNIQSAIELYKSDQNPPVYPLSSVLGGSLCGQCWTSGGSAAACPAGNIYMRKFPCDPQGITTPTPYVYTRNASDNLKYTISTCLENPVDPDKDITPMLAACSKASYTVNEP